MKKLLLIIILLLLPIVVYAKTPNKEETLSVIKDIKNTQVDEDIIIEKVSITDNKIILKLNDEEKEIDYKFENNCFSFSSGYYKEDIIDNDYAFYLYSILENKSSIPYDEDNYYNNNKIKELIENDYKDSYKEPTNTFGITLNKEKDKVYITYNYYVDGEYPIVEFQEANSELVNPATGNYSLIITIMLIGMICIAFYTVMDPKKSK